MVGNVVYIDQHNKLIMDYETKTWNGVALLLSIVLFLVVIIVLITRFFMELRDTMLFKPIDKHIYDPVENYEEHMVDGRINTWYFDRNNREQKVVDNTTGNNTGKVIMFLHGNLGNISHREYMIHLTRLLGVDLFMIDYSGYGKSKGIASVNNMRRDALRAFDYLNQKYDNDNIILWSESIGSVPASYIVSLRKARILCMMCGISSFKKIKDDKGNINGGIISFVGDYMLKNVDRFKNCDLLSETQTPVFFVHSRDDRLVPYACAIENMENVPEHLCRGVVEIKGGHSTPHVTMEELREILNIMGLATRNESELEKWLEYMKTCSHALEFYAIDV